MDEIITIAAQDAQEAQEALGDLVELFKLVFAPEVARVWIPGLLLFILIQVFFLKTGLIDFNKAVNEAIANNRVIKATIDEKRMTKSRYYGSGSEDGTRHFWYKYTHPLTGREKRFLYPIIDGSIPRKEETLYYNEKGKVFCKHTAAYKPAFWTVIGYIVPFAFSVFLQFIFN